MQKNLFNFNIYFSSDRDKNQQISQSRIDRSIIDHTIPDRTML